MVEDMSVVVNVVSNECNVPTSCLVQPIGTHGGEVIYFGCVCFRGELGFLNCDDISMCVVNKQFELLEFVFDSVHVDLQYDEISFTFTVGSVSWYCVCSHVVVFGLLLLYAHQPMVSPHLTGFRARWLTGGPPPFNQQVHHFHGIRPQIRDL